jgi:isopenicillin N synthase-like dioxygenase
MEGTMTGLRTFGLPDSINGTDIGLAREMISALQSDGIFQVSCSRHQSIKIQDTFEASRRFFAQPHSFKSKCISDLTYAGYLASDDVEIFTVCQDIPLNDTRVRAKWPCHGPVPWPSAEYRRTMQSYLTELGMIGDKLLEFIALGLDLPMDTLTSLTDDGWHHMRALRFPAHSRGIGDHTAYGMLVIAAQDDVGGLHIRPPVPGENDSWIFVPPVRNVLTVFPGDILQFLTEGRLLATPTKVSIGDRERYTMAYFHEPNFNSKISPLFAAEDSLHYGTHFTNTFMRCYPDRITTQRINAEDRLVVLAGLRDSQ